MTNRERENTTLSFLKPDDRGLPGEREYSIMKSILASTRYEESALHFLSGDLRRRSLKILQDIL